MQAGEQDILLVSPFMCTSVQLDADGTDCLLPPMQGSSPSVGVAMPQLSLDGSGGVVGMSLPWLEKPVGLSCGTTMQPLHRTPELLLLLGTRTLCLSLASSEDPTANGFTSTFLLEFAMMSHLAAMNSHEQTSLEAAEPDLAPGDIASRLQEGRWCRSPPRSDLLSFPSCAPGAAASPLSQR